MRVNSTKASDLGSIAINIARIKIIGMGIARSRAFALLRSAVYCGIAASSAQVSAATFDWALVDGASNFFGSGTLTTSDTLDALGGYDVIAATGFFKVGHYNGTADGGEVLGVLNNPAAPNPASIPYYSPLSTYDNVLYPKSGTGVVPVLDTSGIAFITANGYVNISLSPFSYSTQQGVLPTYYESETPSDQSYWAYNDGYLFGISRVASDPDSASAVPEADSWAMMIGGFGLIGATMRRKKPSVSFV